MISIALAALFVLSASAMIMKLTYVKVSDEKCNKCSITNEGANRKCGICGGFLNGGTGKFDEDGWTKADFTCNKCGHQSTWKYKNK